MPPTPDPTQPENSQEHEHRFLGPGSFEGLSDAEKAELKELLEAGQEEEVERRLAVHRAAAGHARPDDKYVGEQTRRHTNSIWSVRGGLVFVALIVAVLLLFFFFMSGGHK